MFNKLPTEIKFTFRPGAGIYMPGKTIPTEVRGLGYLTLLFEVTENPELLSVSLQDIWFRVSPFDLPIDIDRDGQFESIEITSAEIDSTFFDLEASKGTLNIKTGDFALDWVYEIDPEQHPILKRLGEKPIKIAVSDYGKMNLEDGSFEIHSPVIIRVEDGPFAGAAIRGSGWAKGKFVGTSVKLNVAIAMPGIDCQDINQDRVWICPGDPVVFCWNASSDVKQVELSPVNVKFNKTDGVYVDTPVLPNPPAPSEVVYKMEALGGKNPADDTVEIQFLRAGEWHGPFYAKPDGFRWVLEIPPYTCSSKFQVQRIRLVPGKKCLSWKRFFVEHIPLPPPAGPGGGIDLGMSFNGGFELPHLVTAAGTWYFVAEVDPKTTTPPPKPWQRADLVCFEFQGECVP